MQADIWSLLAGNSLFWLTLTVGIFLLAERVSRATGNHPLANPVLLSIGLIVTILRLGEVDYADYLAGSQLIHLILGPATVALAVPLWRHRRQVREMAFPILAALAVGAPFAMASALAIASVFGLSKPLQLSLIPKSTTAGIAVGVADVIGGNPSLTVVLVILTGIIGAIAVTPIMNAMNIRDIAARGFALGLTSHGIGTARAFQVDPVAGTFSSLAMALNGFLTALAAGWLFA